MKAYTRWTASVVLGTLLAAGGGAARPARAALPENYLRRWDDPAVERRIDRGIEKIGFQFHFFRRRSLDGYLGGDRCDPHALLDTYEMFARLGLPLWITEITIGSAGEDGLEVQRRVVRDVYRLWFSAPNMAGITWWNLGDGTAYKNEGVAGGGLADRDFRPKPAYEALDQLINHDWKTRLETKSGADGRAAFRGFHGRYEVEVTSGGKTETFELAVGPGEAPEATLTLP